MCTRRQRDEDGDADSNGETQASRGKKITQGAEQKTVPEAWSTPRAGGQRTAVGGPGARGTLWEETPRIPPGTLGSPAPAGRAAAVSSRAARRGRAQLPLPRPGPNGLVYWDLSALSTSPAKPKYLA